MSVPYKDSPFKDGRLPCVLCQEDVEDRTIICTHDGKVCDPTDKDRCKFYQPVDEVGYRVNLQQSLHPMWVRVDYHDKGYYRIECSHCGEEIPLNHWKQDYYSRFCPDCGEYLYPDIDSPIEPISVKPGIYRHYKGRYYKVLGVAEHSETEEKLVVYQALYGHYKIYVRPLETFAEDIEDLKNGYRGPRFYRAEEVE